MRGSVKIVVPFIAILLVFTGSFVGVREARSWYTRSDAAVARIRDGDTERRPHSNETRSELVLVYIGQSTCKWCNDPNLPSQIAQVREFLERKAFDRGQHFVMAGVAVDRSAQSGITHLGKIGAFDQIYSGGGWSNEAAFKYVWDGLPGTPATPTLVVTERMLSVPDSTRTVTRYTIGEERVLIRKVGVFEIERWVRDGVPLPRITGSIVARVN